MTFLMSDDKRTFDGVANTGKVFYYHDTPTIIDMDSVSWANSTPALILHDREKRAGFGKLSLDNGQLKFTGELLDNEHGKQVADEAVSGFPWQLSAHVKAQYKQILTGDETAVVNGQLVKAPTQILKNSFIAEVSFTPTGVDNGTHVVILSEDDMTNELTALQAEKAKLQAEKDKLLAENEKLLSDNTALQDEKDKLADEKAKLEADKQAATIDAALSAKGFKKGDDGAWQGLEKDTLDVLLSLDSDKAVIMINSLFKADVPDYLLGEQYGKGETNPLLADLESRFKQA